MLYIASFGPGPNPARPSVEHLAGRLPKLEALAAESRLQPEVVLQLLDSIEKEAQLAAPETREWKLWDPEKYEERRKRTAGFGGALAPSYEELRIKGQKLEAVFAQVRVLREKLNAQLAKRDE